MKPLISIGITCFNAADTIQKAVKSALDQTWPNIEVVIVDDKSSDGSFAILKVLSAEHDNVTVIAHPENQGVAGARNSIIDAAKGEFLAFFDDDDESHPDRIKLQYERIISYEDMIERAAPVICHTARKQIYPDGSEHYATTLGTNTGIVPNGEQVALRTLIGKPVPYVFGSTATCSQMARLSTYKQLDGFDTNFRRSEDTDFNVRAALVGSHFAGISEALVTQRMTKAEEKNLDEEEFYHLMLIDKHKGFIEKFGSSKFCRNWLINKHRFLKAKYLGFVSGLILLFITSPISTIQRLKWSIPGLQSNIKANSFHND